MESTGKVLKVQYIQDKKWAYTIVYWVVVALILTCFKLNSGAVWSAGVEWCGPMGRMSDSKSVSHEFQPHQWFLEQETFPSLLSTG